MRLLAFVIAVACWSAPNHALAESDACETRTERPVSEVVVPFGDPDFPKLSSEAIKIEPGESLCVTGALDGAGDMTGLRLVPTNRDAEGPVISLRLERGEQTKLWVRHTADGWLYYDAFTLLTRQDIATPTSTLPVGPRRLAAESWDHGVRKLLLHGFRFGARPTPTSSRARVRTTRDQNVLNLSATFGFWGGERGTHFDELNVALVRDGFVPLEYTAAQGGVDLDFTVGRTRFGVSLGAGGRTVEHRSTGVGLSTWHSEIGFTAGFDLVRHRGFHVFASTGILTATLLVDRAKGLTLFQDVQPWEGNRVAFSAFEWPLEAGTDYLVPFGRASATERWTFQFGTRLGWIEQLGSGGWATDTDEDQRDITGPAVDLSGPRFRLVLGIGAQNGW